MPAKLLVIDDNEQFRRYLCLTFAAHGYLAIEAGDGIEGMRAYRRHHPDAVLTDIVMPEKDGLELIQEIRACDRCTPIIAICGQVHHLNATYLRSALRLGANVILSKPFYGAELLDDLDVLLQERQAQN